MRRRACFGRHRVGSTRWRVFRWTRPRSESTARLGSVRRILRESEQSERIQNFSGQLGRAVAALSCPRRGHLCELLLVGQKVREDGPNLLQIQLVFDLVVGDDGCFGFCSRFRIESLMLVFVPRIGQVQRRKSRSLYLSHAVGARPRNHQICGTKRLRHLT